MVSLMARRAEFEHEETKLTEAARFHPLASERVKQWNVSRNRYFFSRKQYFYLIHSEGLPPR
jgi:hypothetical protein